MEGMSEREYSAHSGLSRGAIQKARRASRLVVYSDGSINAAASDVRRAEMTDPDQQRCLRRGLGGQKCVDHTAPYPKSHAITRDIYYGAVGIAGMGGDMSMSSFPQSACTQILHP